MAENTSLFELERLAIQKALISSWQEAIDLNIEILDQEPDNIPSLNRLAIAYLKSQEIEKSRKYFEKVIKLDPYNSIAKNNLKRITSSKTSATLLADSPISNHTFSFIEEPGKSKMIPLTNIGEPQIINTIYTGLEVELVISGRKIKVETQNHKYIGSLPDDISSHLIRFIKAGCKYRSLIRSADINRVEIFVQEIKSSKKMRGIPSFANGHSLDDIEISSGNTSQPPLEIYDQEVDET